MSIRDSKTALRLQVQARLKELTAAQRAAASAQARQLCAAQAQWQQAQAILFFAPLPEESDVWPLVADSLLTGKVVGLPRFVAQTKSYIACQVQNLASDLKSGQFGIREPVEGCAELSLKRL